MQITGPDPSPLAIPRPAMARAPRLQAGLWSLSLHALLLAAASFVPWSIPQTPDSPPARSTVWLRDVRLVSAARAPVTDAVDAARALEALAPLAPRAPEPLRRPETELEPLPAPRETPSGARRPAREPAAESEPSAAPAESTGPEAERPTPPRRVDFEAERRRAARAVVEQRAREREDHPFSFERFDEGVPPTFIEPGPDKDIFDSGRSHGPSLLSSSKARSRAGRWLADKCERITGGVSVFGLLGFCTPNDVRDDFFAEIKPDYLKARPVCTEVPEPAVAVDAAAAAKKTHNCRLVVEEE